MKTQERGTARYLTTCQSNDISEQKSVYNGLQAGPDLTFTSDDPDEKYLTKVREFTDLLFFWNIWQIVTWLFKAYLVPGHFG